MRMPVVALQKNIDIYSLKYHFEVCLFVLTTRQQWTPGERNWEGGGGRSWKKSVKEKMKGGLVAGCSRSQCM